METARHEGDATSVAPIVREYFRSARIDAEVRSAPDSRVQGAAIDPLYDAVEALEHTAGLEAGALWSRVCEHRPSPMKRGLVDVNVPPEWPHDAKIALACALFLTAWEYLRGVDAARARELLQTAEFVMVND